LVASGVLVARTLGPENRGYLALLALFPAILSELGNLGLPLAVTYYIARDRTHAAAIARSGVGPFLLQPEARSVLLRYVARVVATPAPADSVARRAAGFEVIEQRDFGDSRLSPCPDSENRRPKTLYVEAVK
jgi:hypothetical protein